MSGLWQWMWVFQDGCNFLKDVRREKYHCTRTLEPQSRCTDNINVAVDKVFADIISPVSRAPMVKDSQYLFLLATIPPRVCEMRDQIAIRMNYWEAAWVVILTKVNYCGNFLIKFVFVVLSVIYLLNSDWCAIELINFGEFLRPQLAFKWSIHCWDCRYKFTKACLWK